MLPPADLHAYALDPFVYRCMKICSVPRKGNSLKTTAKLLKRSSQKLTDAWTVMVSRAFALGHLPERGNRWIEERQKNLDFLVSSLPGTETQTPPCADLHVCREFTSWHPNIIYCLGLSGMVHMDFYWEVKMPFLKLCTAASQVPRCPILYALSDQCTALCDMHVCHRCKVASTRMFSSARSHSASSPCATTRPCRPCTEPACDGGMKCTA